MRSPGIKLHKLALFGWAVVVTAVLLLVRGVSLFIESLLRFDHCFHMIAASELGKGESSELNRASPLKAIIELNFYRFRLLQAVLPMVKVILPEVHYPLVSKYGPHHENNGMCMDLSGSIIRLGKKAIHKGFEIIVFKDKSGLPKGSERMNIGISGLPKGSNFYGNRATVLPVKGRVAASLRSNNRNYSTYRALNVNIRLEHLHKLSVKIHSHESIKMNIYDLLSNPYFLSYAHKNLEDKSINRASNIRPRAVKEFSIKNLETLSVNLKSEQFKFSPAKDINIFKCLGKPRPLVIVPIMDQIVLEGMRIILKTIFEPVFFNESHGFRPNRDYQTVIDDIKKKLKLSTWFIEGDVSKCFDTADHLIIMKLIEEKILDRQFTKLIWKSLKAGYYEFPSYNISKDKAETAKNSLISPILTDIFLHQLDEFVLKEKNAFDVITSFNLKEVKDIPKKYNLEKEDHKLVNISRYSDDRDYNNTEYKTLNYVRYAGNWIIGINGSHKDAMTIQHNIMEFCTHIKLEVNKTKTKITNVNKDKVLFLGTYITRKQNDKLELNKLGKPRKYNKLLFKVPMDLIKGKLKSTQFIERNISYPKFRWLHLSHDQIIHEYNTVLLDYYKSYSFADNWGKINRYITLILRRSCCKLLTTKFTLKTMSQTYEKFGVDLVSPKGIKFAKLSKKKKL